MKLSTKLMVAFLIVGVLPASVIGLLALNQASTALAQESENKLVALRDTKKNQIEQYLSACRTDLDVLVDNVSVLRQEAVNKLAAIQDMKRSQLEEFFRRVRLDVIAGAQSNECEQFFAQLKQYHDDMNTGPSDPYDVTTETYKGIWEDCDRSWQRYVKDLGYYDVFLICAHHGHVMYTHAKESDLGENLGHGPNKTEGLAQLWQRIMETKALSVVDFAPYTPSNGDPASFMGAPVVNETGEVIAVFALQVPSDPVNQIVQLRSGLGESGESYATGAIDGKTYYRCDRVIKSGKIGQPKSGSGIVKALAGETVRRIKTGSTGSMEIECCDRLSIEGLEWVLSTTINLEEMISVRLEGEKEDFLMKYNNGYGYNDLYLISPKGGVFYSVAHEADYGTNLLTGPYQDSGLGTVASYAINEKQFGFADVAPYAPLNGIPAAFIAQPYLYNGKVELVVALQLSLDKINNVMTQRAGLGETGETILVGSDYLMRSDSSRDPESHSVVGSFGNPATGKVDTPATRAVHERGETGVIEGMTDYVGNKVLLAYTPVDVFGTTWCLNAKVDESEAFAARKAITASIVLVLCIALAAVMGITWILIRSITKPIKLVNTMLEDIAQGDGDLTQRLDVTTKDEIGDLAKWFNLFMDKLQKMITDIASKARIVGGSSTELATVSEQMQQGSQQASSHSTTVAQTAEQMSHNMNTVAAAMEQASTNVNSVASAAEQMSSTIGEIAQNTERASMVTQQAVQETESASNKVSELGGAAEEIGKVTETITEISEQTNLLALNATIEAARAGDAGKGFAVVANEIKELANQTAHATEEIRVKIQGIQSSTGETVHEIEKITKVIGDVNEIVGTIAAAVEEQSTAVREVAGNVSQASSGLGEVNQNVAETSSAAGDVAQNVSELNKTSNEMAQSCGMITDSAGELSKLADTLNTLVGQFKV